MVGVVLECVVWISIWVLFYLFDVYVGTAFGIFLCWQSYLTYEKIQANRRILKSFEAIKKVGKVKGEHDSSNLQ